MNPRLDSAPRWLRRLLCVLALAACAAPALACDDGDGLGADADMLGTDDTAPSDTSTDDTAGDDTATADTSGDTSTGDTTPTDTTTQDTDPGDTSGGDTADVVTALPIGVYGHNAALIEDGAVYFDGATDGIALFSLANPGLFIRNDSSAPVTIASISVTPVAPALEGEWIVIHADDSSAEPQPWSPKDVVLQPDERLDFDMLFVPYEVGHREAMVHVALGDGSAYRFTVRGRGRDNGVFFTRGANAWAKVWGHPSQDALTSGLVGDGSGNVFVTANVTQWIDPFSRDIGVSSVAPDGSLRWQKVWNEDYEQASPDPGQNAESGGSADSIAYGADGYLYVVGRRSLASSNNFFQTLVFKVDPANGAIVWARAWTPITGTTPSLANQSSAGYAIDARDPNRVFVTGVTEGDAKVLFLALNKSDGAIAFDQAIEVVAGSTDRGYAIRSDGAGNVTIAGLTSGSRGLLMRFTGAGTGSAPTLHWARELSMGIGSNVNSLDLDAAGNAYLSLDRRGATTQLSVARFDTDGTLAWAKTWDAANTGDNNNTHVVRVFGSHLYVGGRVALQPFDTQRGEAFLMRLAIADGSYDWGTFYYGGKGAEEMAEHRVKGIAVDGDNVRLGLQSYTSQLNFSHYWGFWYNLTDSTNADPPGDGAVRLADYTALTLTDRSADVSLADVADGTAHVIDTSTLWVDPPEAITYEDATVREGSGTDGDVALMNLVLEP